MVAYDVKQDNRKRPNSGILKKRGSFIVFDSPESAKAYAAYVRPLGAWGMFPAGTPEGDKGYAWGRVS